MDRRSALKVIGAGGCGLACLGGVGPLLNAVEKNNEKNNEKSDEKVTKPDHPFALFDVDSRELNPAGNGFSFRQRVEPLAPQLKRLYALADKHSAPLVFTVCCSGRMLEPRSLPNVLVVPLDAADRRWEAKRAQYRLFNVEKKTYKEPGSNFTCAAYDMFKDNGNAAHLIKSLNVGEWVVFGNGFDLCINAAVRGLLAAGQKVCLLSDVYVQGARGYFVPTADGGQIELGTPENLARVLAEFQQHGVRSLTLDQFAASVS